MGFMDLIKKKPSVKGLIHKDWKIKDTIEKLKL